MDCPPFHFGNVLVLLRRDFEFEQMVKIGGTAALVPPLKLLQKTCSAYSDCKNVMSWFFCVVLRAR